MESTTGTAPAPLGTLHVEDGAGAVRIEVTCPAPPADVWAAVTEPARLAHWYGQVDGDLVPGGRFHVHIEPAGWDGTGVVERCEPPHSLQVRTREGTEPGEQTLEVALAAVDGGTRLALRAGGLPVGNLAAYGVGWQLHVEDLLDHLAGRAPADELPRWAALQPAYQRLAADLDGPGGHAAGA